MNFKIIIGCSDTGSTAIGANDVAALSGCVDTEHVFGSQLRHRVAAKRGGVWGLCTPTAAKGADEVALGCWRRA